MISISNGAEICCLIFYENPSEGLRSQILLYRVCFIVVHRRKSTNSIQDTIGSGICNYIAIYCHVTVIIRWIGCELALEN